MIQVNRIYLIFNRLVTKKFLVDTSDDTYIVYLIDQRDVFFCDLREWKQVVLVCPKHKLASPLTEGQSVLSASK